MNLRIVKTKRIDKNIPLPYKKIITDAGYDVYTSEDIWLMPFQTKKIKSNHSILIPDDLFAAMFPRSSIREKGYLIDGIIDAGFKGYFKIIATNVFPFPRRIRKSTRIAQIVFLKYESVELEEVMEYNEETERGYNGFGHTGKK